MVLTLGDLPGWVSGTTGAPGPYFENIALGHQSLFLPRPPGEGDCHSVLPPTQSVPHDISHHNAPNQVAVL